MNVPRAETIRLDIPTSYHHLSIVSACIAELLGQVTDLIDREVLIYNVQLAVHEACTNIVDHAYDGEPRGRVVIDLTYDTSRTQLVVELHDTGHGFDLTGVPALNLEQPQEHGYGLFLIRNLMDDVIYTPGPDGNYWRLVKLLR
jgi:serine/threonine-protein kinase RsbW